MVGRPRAPLPEVGDRIGDLFVLGVQVPEGGHTRVDVVCACGWRTNIRWSDIRLRKTGPCTGHKGGRPAKNTVSYMYAHARVRYERGDAGKQRCVQCLKPAEAWALNYSASHAMFYVDPKWGTFSMDTSAYQPMCRDCHAAYDRAARRLAIVAGWIVPKRIKTRPAPPRRIKRGAA